MFLPRPPVASFEHAGKSDTDPAIDSIEIRGPYNGKTPATSPSRRKIFVCEPRDSNDEASCARHRLR